MNGEKIHKGNKRAVVKLKEYFLSAVKKPSFFISIFIILEIFPAYSLRFKNNSKLIEDKKPIVNVLYEEGNKELTPIVKEQKLSIIGSTEKYMFFYDHSDSSKMIIPKNKIVSIKSETLAKTDN
jgi:hypothetical protein